MTTVKDQTPITVLMPVYNAERYIKEAVESILNQTFSDFVLLIINDGCSDNTMSMIGSYHDRRIKIVENERNLGLIATLNKGLDLVETKFVARMDADDFSMPGRLETQLKFMESRPEVGACGTWYDNILDDGTERDGGRYLPAHEEILFKNLYQLHIIHGTTMMRMEVIRKHGLKFDASFPHAEDYDFFVRFAEHSKLHNIQESLYKIRHHGESVSKKFSDVQETNSNTVKRRIFNQIGVEVNDEQLNQYREFMHQNYPLFARAERGDLMALISDLIRANRRTLYLPNDFLRKELALRVMHLFNQLAGSEKGMFAELHSFKHTRFLDDPKLFLTTYSKVLLS